MMLLCNMADLLYSFLGEKKKPDEFCLSCVIKKTKETWTAEMFFSCSSANQKMAWSTLINLKIALKH